MLGIPQLTEPGKVPARRVHQPLPELLQLLLGQRALPHPHAQQAQPWR